MLKSSWDPDTMRLGYSPRYGLDESGQPTLQFIGNLADQTTRHYVVREDGTVRSAYYEPTGTVECKYWTAGVGGNHYAWDHSDEPKDEGWVGGTLDERQPSQVYRFTHEPSSTSSWSASAQYLVRHHNGVTAQAWGGESFLVYSPGADFQPLPVARTHAVADAIFAEVGTLEVRGVMAWSQKTGIQPLLRFYDGTKGALNFRSDGKDMVWTYGEGKMPDENTFAKTSVMTAPHTTDPAEVVKTQHRLRSDLGWSGLSSYAVGCGYAARAAFTSEFYAGMYVVRLSDGVGWILKSLPDPNDYGWNTVLGITCDEIFAVLLVNKRLQLARIRLDSLGPGLPPD